MYYLDSNIYIYFAKHAFPSLSDKLLSIQYDKIKIPSIVAAELLYGAEKSRRRAFNLPRVKQFLSYYEIMPFDEEAADCYRIIRTDLERKGTPVGGNDMIIAATVLSRGGILVTNNTKEFSRIGGLALEDWTD